MVKNREAIGILNPMVVFTLETENPSETDKPSSESVKIEGKTVIEHAITKRKNGQEPRSNRNFKSNGRFHTRDGKSV